jgi:hypothetical protein
MRTARTLEEEWRQVLSLSVNTGAKNDEPSTGRVWAAGFHLVNARSHVAGVLKLTNLYFFNFPIFFRAALNRGELKPRVLNQWIGGHTCISNDTPFFNIFRTKSLTK